ncbi:MAG: L,D-transpeptidase family protein [Lachnospiraceae bacterium]|nr:L,D-transpeptidase family protein [Lachnospiraceae bacterium]
MNSRYTSGVRQADEGSTEHCRVFEPISPDANQSVDEKLNKAIELMISETIGEPVIHKTSSGSSNSNTKQNNNDAKGHDPGKKKMSGGKIFLIVFLVIVALLAAGYAYIASTYEGIFFEGTFINGVDVGGMTVDEVEEEIRQNVESYELALTFREAGTEVLTAEQLGFEYVSSNAVQQAMDAQNKWLWITAKMGETRKYTAEKAFKHDEKAVKATIEALPQLDEAKARQPVDAYLKLADDKTFKIIPEERGTVVLKNKLLKVVNDTITKGESELDVSEMDAVYKEAAVTSKDKDLNTQMNDLNGFLDITVTYTLPKNQEQVLDRTITVDWIDQAEDGYYFINVDKLHEKACEYVKAMAEKVDEVKKERMFNSTLRGSLSIKCPEYGTVIDQPGEVEALTNNLVGRVTEKREPVYVRNDGEADPNFGGNFIEVDITNQHVFFYKDGQQMWDAPCVTGYSQDPGRATPKGVYDIKSKEKNRTLRGDRLEDGSYSYESFVSYWMPFYHGYGLHDASWRGDFGGDIYTWGGSHGCVNLPPSKAGALYDLISVGTTVIVF